MSIETIAATSIMKNHLLSLNENHFTDFKSRQIKPAKLQETFVAFANADGGELYIGLEDKKKGVDRIIGFSMQEDANDIIDVLLTKTNPSVEGVDLEFFDFGADGFILHITIPKSPKVHYTDEGKCYVRLNASSRSIKGEQVTQLAYSKGSVSYERTTLSHVDIEEIVNSRLLSDYIKRLDSDLPALTFLRKQRLVLQKDKEWFPTVASILLFDEEPQAALDTRCAIKLYRLRTTDSVYKREHLEEGHPITIEGSIEQQIAKVISEVNRMLEGVMVQIRGKLRKVDYPAEALRELIVNAILHRDYSLNDDIHIRIYDNRVEITSPGKLPGHITPSNILDERFARNPIIVRLLHKLPNPVNYDIGEGLNTAFNAMHRAGLENPVIEEETQAVKVTIAHKKIASLESIILDFLDENATVTNRDIRKISGEESVNKVKKAFQKLRKEGLIEPIDINATAFAYSYRKVNR
jgi:ATP-dependent DNA helicase RecG